jgi:hypothetical protein
MGPGQSILITGASKHAVAAGTDAAWARVYRFAPAADATRRRIMGLPGRPRLRRPGG